MHSFVRGVDNFFKKHSTLLKTTALILMLVIPFLLYAAAAHDALFQVKLLLVLMGANMLYVMLRG
jgi:lipoprotein signal peptidase